MIIETVIVGTTPTSLLDLILAARKQKVPRKITVSAFMIRNDTSNIIYAEDPETDTKVILVDPAPEQAAQSQPFASYPTDNLKQTILSADVEGVSVGLIIT